MFELFQDEVTELRSENTLRRLEVEDLRLEAGRRRAELEELRLEAARRRVEVEEMEGKITDLRDTLDCTYTGRFTISKEKWPSKISTINMIYE